MIGIDRAIVLLHEAGIEFNYSVDPARYEIKQKDLPVLFEFIARELKQNEGRTCGNCRYAIIEQLEPRRGYCAQSHVKAPLEDEDFSCLACDYWKPKEEEK